MKKLLFLITVFSVIIFCATPTEGAGKKNKKNENRLSIFFKTTECASKCYFPLNNINKIAGKIKIEFVIAPEEKDYALEIINSYEVNPKAYSLREPTKDEKAIYSGPLSYYIFQSMDITLFGSAVLLEYLNNNIDSLLSMKPASAKLHYSKPGIVGIFPPFEVVGNKSFIYEERLKKFYIDSMYGSKVIQSGNYFNLDSTYLIFRIFPEWKKAYYEFTNSGSPNDGAYIRNITTWQGKPILLGSFTSALTPLYKANKRHFLIYFDDSIISRQNYTYIDNNKRLGIGLDNGIGIIPGQDNFKSFHSIVWQSNRPADSFFVAQYNYSATDSTWYQGDIYVLDTARKGINYFDNMQFVSGNYAIHADLPVLYSYPEVKKFDLSPMLSHVFQRTIYKELRLPKGYNIVKVWNDDKKVKFYCASQEEIYCVSLERESGIYEIRHLSGSSLPPLKQFRNLGFDTAGTPVLLYNAGKNHELWKIE